MHHPELETAVQRCEQGGPAKALTAAPAASGKPWNLEFQSIWGSRLWSILLDSGRSSVQASGCRIFFTHKKYFQCVKPVVRFLQIHPKHPKKGNVAKHRVTQNSFHVLLPVDWPRALINVVFALHLVVIRAENGRKLAEPPS